MTVLLSAGLVVWLGLGVLPFLGSRRVLGEFSAHLGQLHSNTMVCCALNARRAACEVCQPHHSWNSNHAFSNWALFHLQRHSDHHAHPLRRYQSLRHFDGVPRLPSGYFSGMFLVAYVPPLWRYLMDERLLAVVGRRRAARQPGSPAARGAGTAVWADQRVSRRTGYMLRRYCPPTSNKRVGDLAQRAARAPRPSAPQTRCRCRSPPAAGARAWRRDSAAWRAWKSCRRCSWLLLFFLGGAGQFAACPAPRRHAGCGRC